MVLVRLFSGVETQVSSPGCVELRTTAQRSRGGYHRQVTSVPHGTPLDCLVAVEAVSPPLNHGLEVSVISSASTGYLFPTRFATRSFFPR
jgi:hypothetical protein